MPAGPTPPGVPRAALLSLAALLATALVGVAVLLTTSAGSPSADAAVANLAECVLSGLAAATAAWRGLACTGRSRVSWLATAVGCAGWAAGQGMWTWYELVAEREVPFPSWADVGFLAFPIGLAVALCTFSGRAPWRQRRRVLDALTVTAALTLVSWSTALSSVVEAGGDHPLAFVVSVAYPASDLVLLVLVALSLGESRGERTSLALLGSGLVSFVVADSAFAWQTASGSFSSGNAVDLGWMAGFALLAVAPLAWRGQAGEPPRWRAATIVMPYASVLVAAAVVGVRRVEGGRLSVAETTLVGVVLLLVLARQFVTLRENRSLMAELAAREAELRHQAFHDGLTGLANRALFADRLEHALELHRSDLRPLAVLLCDLDDFKVVNDTQGHAVGDELLVRVAERLRGALRSADTLARLGGDEFAVLLEHGDQAEVVAERMAAALEPPFTLGGAVVRVRASIGLAVLAAQDQTPVSGELLVRADTAMYSAKRDGKGRVRVHQPGMSLVEVEEQRMADALGTAIADRSLSVAYQPVVAVASGEVEGLECLARWTWEDQAVPPSVFVPVAERNGLVADLTDLVLEAACERLVDWSRRLGHDRLRIGVNVAPFDLVSSTLPGRVQNALRRHGLDADRLVLEVTESGLLPDLDAARAATRELAALGVRLALDDFGVGYSSLAHLSSIPLTILKIDRAFVAGLGEDPDQERFVRALLSLGDDLGLSVVAEGVERPEQLAVLRALGCEMAQGYLLARPVPAEDVLRVLELARAAATVPLQRAPSGH